MTTVESALKLVDHYLLLTPQGLEGRFSSCIPVPFSQQSRIPNFCQLYPENHMFPSTTSHVKILANPASPGQVKSHVTSRHFAFPQTNSLFQANLRFQDYPSRT